MKSIMGNGGEQSTLIAEDWGYLEPPTGTVFHWSLNRAPEPDRGGQSQGPLLAIMFTAETVT